MEPPLKLKPCDWESRPKNSLIKTMKKSSIYSKNGTFPSTTTLELKAQFIRSLFKIIFSKSKIMVTFLLKKLSCFAVLSVTVSYLTGS